MVKRKSKTPDRYMVHRLFPLILSLLVFLLSTQTARAQQSSWYPITSPVYSDVKHLFLIDDSLSIVSGSQVVSKQNSKWEAINKVRSDINVVAVSKDGSIFISESNKYQESILYNQNGKDLDIVNHPMVGAITSMFFKSKSKGIIAGLGEICVLSGKKWMFLDPPTNKGILSITMDDNDNIFALSFDNKLYKYAIGWKQIDTRDKIISISLHEGEIFVLTNHSIGKIVQDQIINLSSNKELNLANAFDVIDSNEFVAVGQNGLILLYKNGNWLKENSTTKKHLYAVKMIDKNTGWCAGQDGVMLHYSAFKPQIDSSYTWKGFEPVELKGKAKMIDDEYGVVVADFNNDSKPDIFTCGLFESENLYINSGNFNFSYEAEKWGINKNSKNSKTLYHLGACAGDIDNDGYTDLYITTLNETNRILKNIKGKRFEDYSNISGGIGLSDDRSNACLMGDIDNDGDLDVFVLNEYSSNRLYLNNGAGIFKEITVRAGLQTQGGGMSGSFGDVDNDGDIDLYISNWSSTNVLYQNNWVESGEIFFTDISESAGVKGEKYTKSNGVVFNDIDNDGDLDLFVANRKFTNSLFVNNGAGKFIDRTSELIGKDSLKTNGVIIEDFDGDGWKDIYLSNVGPNTFFKGQPDGTFIDHTEKYGLGLDGYSTGLALGDFDSDGDYDIYAANYIDESSLLYKNNLEDKENISVKIKGYKNTRAGIGAQIYTYAGGHMDDVGFLLDYRQLSAGQGYASMNEHISIIPLNGYSKADIKVIFPSGIIRTKRGLEAKSTALIQDVDGWKIHVYQSKTRLFSVFKNPYLLSKYLKRVLVFILSIAFVIICRRKFNWGKVFSVLVLLTLLASFFIQDIYLEYTPIMLSTIVPLVTIAGLMVMLYFFYERKWIKLNAEIQHQQIRNKIARDLHDDLAATISTIGIYLSLIQKHGNESDTKQNKLFEQANKLIGNAATRVSDLIWAIKAKPETLEQFFSRIQNNFGNLFYEKGIDFLFKLDVKDEKIVLDAAIKQNVYLIIKEALNNIAKYAKAKKIVIEANKENNKIGISITDNGIGFILENAENLGYGLNNMKKRAEEIDASFTIWSKPGEGTICTLILTHN